VKDDFIKPIAILTIICLVVSGALAMTNGVTAPIINEAAAVRAQLAMEAIIPHATGFEQVSHDEFPRAVREAYKTENDVGYIFIVSVNGFSGDIRVICGIDSDGLIISSSTLSHTETKGIGCILDEERWNGPFSGKDAQLDGISAVTGATISTVAYMNAILAAFDAFELIRGV